MAEQFHFCEEIVGAGAEKQFTRVTLLLNLTPETCGLYYRHIIISIDDHHK